MHRAVSYPSREPEIGQPELGVPEEFRRSARCSDRAEVPHNPRRPTPKERTMRNGFRVIDSDTHVNPSLDVLLRYADRELRERIGDLAPYRQTVKPRPGQGDAEDLDAYSILTIKPVRLTRVAGEKPGTGTQEAGDRGFLSGRTQMVTRHPITPRVAEDNAQGRLRDMDLEGRDLDFIIPGPWAYGASALAPHLTR